LSKSEPTEPEQTQAGTSHQARPDPPERLDEATRALTSVAAEWDRRLQTIKRIAGSINEEQSRAARE
jgi:hypothetical protein